MSNQSLPRHCSTQIRVRHHRYHVIERARFRKHPTMAAVLRCAGGYLLFVIHRHLKVGYPSWLWWQFWPRKRASTQSTQPPLMPSHPKMQTKMRHLGMIYLSVSRTSDCLRDQFLALLICGRACKLDGSLRCNRKLLYGPLAAETDFKFWMIWSPEKQCSFLSVNVRPARLFK